MKTLEPILQLYLINVTFGEDNMHHVYFNYLTKAAALSYNNGLRSYNGEGPVACGIVTAAWLQRLKMKANQFEHWI